MPGYFNGIPVDAVVFYQQLALDNSKEFWSANKERYQRSVREPVEMLVGELEDQFGAAKIFRPNRDVRFSNDKSPYKTHQGAYVPAGQALGWYIEVSGDGALTGGGFYHAEPTPLAALRRTIDEHGDELAELVGELVAEGWQLRGETLKTAPRGFSADHPHIELLRHKTLSLSRFYGEDPVVATPNFAEIVRDDWASIRPLIMWLGEALASEE
ncbi:DUF2461 domain-containing protein [Tessaracoccus sp. OS52]|uniref:DUF2461 domain-containing protein n=1 Tax=Tessaracoccus sp. OS52 TaxID=2886691 RepID=UPI001D108ED8|nr:DUF2461 domain-containing protein [Tessaracoccus sp. OS52]